MAEIKKISKSDYEGLTLAQVKNFLKVDLSLTAEDDLLTMLLKGVVDSVESYCNIALRETTTEVIFDDFDIDEGEVMLPIYPAKSITKVWLIDSLGNETESLYTQRGYDLKASAWREDEKIKVEYIAGYSESLPEPEAIKICILQTILDWYNDRDNLGVLPGKVRRGLNEYSFKPWM